MLAFRASFRPQVSSTLIVLTPARRLARGLPSHSSHRLEGLSKPPSHGRSALRQRAGGRYALQGTVAQFRGAFNLRPPTKMAIEEHRNDRRATSASEVPAG
jgi:hypothetical protein